jgi:hypothetical protein
VDQGFGERLTKIFALMTPRVSDLVRSLAVANSNPQPFVILYLAKTMRDSRPKSRIQKKRFGKVHINQLVNIY